MKDLRWIVFFLSVSVACLWVLHFLSPDPLVIEREQDRGDRARFMLECVSDHQYAPSTCAAIWEGEDPPQMPNGVEPAC